MRDSNARPLVPETNALSAELIAPKVVSQYLELFSEKIINKTLVVK